MLLLGVIYSYSIRYGKLKYRIIRRGALYQLKYVCGDQKQFGSRFLNKAWPTLSVLNILNCPSPALNILEKTMGKQRDSSDCEVSSRNSAVLSILIAHGLKPSL